jgi:integrase
VATLVKTRWLLEDLAAPLAGRPIAQITAPEVLALLRTIEAKGNLESAARLRGAIGRIFRYAIVTGRAVADPTAALKGALRPPQVRHQPALTDPARVGELLRAIDGAEGSRVVRAALLSENTLNAALRRLGYSADEMTSHGFRTIASTLLNESGQWNPDAIERALAHQDTNAVRRAHARAAYWDERTRMAVWWADYLDRLRLNTPLKPS